MNVPVLIVEDDNVTARIIEISLCKSSNTFKFSPTRVSSLPEAQAELSTNKYDCILLDLILPPHGIDETFEWVSSNNWNDLAVVIVMTGCEQDEVNKRMDKYDMQFLLLKDYIMQDVQSLSLVLLQSINQSIIKDVKRKTEKLKRFFE